MSFSKQEVYSLSWTFTKHFDRFQPSMKTYNFQNFIRSTLIESRKTLRIFIESIASSVCPYWNNSILESNLSALLLNVLSCPNPEKSVIWLNSFLRSTKVEKESLLMIYDALDVFNWNGKLARWLRKVKVPSCLLRLENWLPLGGELKRVA